MAEIKTTETLVDRQAAKKKLEGEITLLKQEEGHATRTRNEAVLAAEAMETRKSALIKDMEDLGAYFKETASFTHEFMAECLKTVKEGKENADRLIATLKEIGRQTEGEIKAFEKARKQKEEVMAEIGRERIVLDNHRHDLDIYKARVEKAIREAGLNIKIIL